MYTYETLESILNDITDLHKLIYTVIIMLAILMIYFICFTFHQSVLLKEIKKTIEK